MGKKRSAPARTTEVDVDEAVRLLSLLDEEGQLPEDEKLRLLRGNMELCTTTCKANRKDSPNCFCCFVPTQGSYRKKGLWQKDPVSTVSLGSDPSESKREDVTQPCGLRNLGNTCYVSSALQCLFYIPSFRHALYKLESPHSDNPIVSNLRELFLQLEQGPRAAADPKQFADCLQLDHSIQQDGQEFWKLLLSKLESFFEASEHRDLKHAVQTLFSGKFSYVTTCKECHRPSASSKQETAFYELPLQVQGMSSVPESLVASLASESLEGDNQYFCEFCRHKVDATRQMVLRETPPYLCLALQRFVFNMQTYQRTKATGKMSFPEKLDLATLLTAAAADGVAAVPRSADGPGSLQYELVGVLIHKGASASHGHYVAHVKHPSSGMWWRYDDEAVVAMGTSPTSHPQDHGLSPAAAAADKKKAAEATVEGVEEAEGNSKKKKGTKSRAGSGGSKRKRAAEQVEVEAIEEADDAAAGTSNGAEEKADIVSANAYMLVYKRAQWQDPHLSHMGSVPEALQEVVARMTTEFQESCSSFAAGKERIAAEFAQRQQMVRNILEGSPVPAGERGCYWISSAWLEEWANNANQSPPIDNAPLLCRHGKLDPAKWQTMKRITTVAWHELQNTFGGGPQLSTGDACDICLREMLKAVRDQGEADVLKDEVLDNLPDDAEEQAGWFYVSKTWLAGFKKRKSKGLSAASPTAAITCPHGSLLPRAAKGGARSAVPPEVWTFIKRRWHDDEARRKEQQPQQQAANPPTTAGDASSMEVEIIDDPATATNHAATSNGHDLTEAAADSNPEQSPGPPIADLEVGCVSECPMCMATLENAVETAAAMRSAGASERSLLPSLASGVALTLQPGPCYYLVPSGWLKHWQEYANWTPQRKVGAVAAVAATVKRPPPLPEAMAQVLCTCHPSNPGLCVKAPTVVNRRGRYQQEDAAKEALVLVTEADWQKLLALYGPSAAEGDTGCPVVQAYVQLQGRSDEAGGNDAMDERGNAEAANGAAAVEEEPSSPPTARRSGEEAAQCVLMTVPGVCPVAIAAQEAEGKRVRLAYDDVEVMVELIKAEELASAFTTGTGERKSKRARKNRAPVRVSSSTTVRELKMKVFETLGVHPLDCMLYVRGAQLEQDDASMAAAEVFPDEEIRAVSANQHDPNDVSSLFPGSAEKGGRREVEVGFRNTALHSSSPHAAPPAQQSTAQQEAQPQLAEEEPALPPQEQAPPCSMEEDEPTGVISCSLEQDKTDGMRPGEADVRAARDPYDTATGMALEGAVGA